MKLAAPLFSVITVCYNDRANLEVTSASVLEQRFADFEWLVVDGNSMDDTRTFLEEIDDRRLSWTSESDFGLFDAMNKGMERATGQYLIFMNSGDMFHDSGTLEMVAAEIRAAPELPQLVYGDSINYSADGNQYYKRANSHHLHWRGMFAQHQAMFFANTPLRYDLSYKLTADYAFIGDFLKSTQQAGKIIRLHRPICRFLLGGINEKKRFRALYEDFAIRRKVLEMSVWTSAALYGLHYGHTLIKQFRLVVALAIRRAF